MQNLEFLGAILDYNEFFISIPPRRIKNCLQAVREIEHSLRDHRRVHVKLLASFVGQVISMSIDLGNE